MLSSQKKFVTKPSTQTPQAEKGKKYLVKICFWIHTSSQAKYFEISNLINQVLSFKKCEQLLFR